MPEAGEIKVCDNKSTLIHTRSSIVMMEYMAVLLTVSTSKENRFHDKADGKPYRRQLFNDDNFLFEHVSK